MYLEAITFKLFSNLILDLDRLGFKLNKSYLSYQDRLRGGSSLSKYFLNISSINKEFEEKYKFYFQSDKEGFFISIVNLDVYSNNLGSRSLNIIDVCGNSYTIKENSFKDASRQNLINKENSDYLNKIKALIDEYRRIYFIIKRLKPYDFIETQSSYDYDSSILAETIKEVMKKR